MIVASYSIPDLAKLLNYPYRKTYRLAITLNFNKQVINNKITYDFHTNDPLIQSMIIQTKYTKLIYTINDISKLWCWRRGNYSNERVRQLLKTYNIPIHNKGNKGLIYLSDLQKLLSIY